MKVIKKRNRMRVDLRMYALQGDRGMNNQRFSSEEYFVYFVPRTLKRVYTPKV